ncbi:hypothetical protein BD410DRAFT_787904 [Rickenella mellea]|uniref:Hypervirulence associated protein TUDOR domain-containing protein n=1 Tax=Rickenella mellea TaxID=50990 RepID=A0A4Y7Q6X3_9AGAM|nr:hypothetical protein BD410DRAFT_787904 [Rickenella mellea]
MSNIEEGDRVSYIPIHQYKNPDNVNKATGEVTQINSKPKKDDPDHQTYTIMNERSQKETTYGERNIVEKLDNEEGN